MGLTLRQKAWILMGRIFLRWRTFMTFIVPLAFSPILFVFGHNTKSNTLYAVLVVFTYWLLVLVPLPVASLLPIIMLPLLNIESTSNVCRNYFTEASMTLLGCTGVSLAVESTLIHRRLALKTVLVFGTNPRWLLTGLMLLTMFLAMWLNNSATANMMLPIAEAVLDEVYPERQLAIMNDSGSSAKSDVQPRAWRLNSLETNQSRIPPTPPPAPPSTPIWDSMLNRPPSPRSGQALTEKMLFSGSQHTTSTNKRSSVGAIGTAECVASATLMGVGYAATIGGIGTILGSNPTLILKQTLFMLFENETGVNYLTWMAYCFPCMILSTLATCLWVQGYFFGLKPSLEMPWKQIQDPSVLKLQSVIDESYTNLGPITGAECIAVTIYILMVILLTSRETSYSVIPGWSFYFAPVHVNDATPAILIMAILFLVLSAREAGRKEDIKYEILNWARVRERIPWGVLLLMGGGLALGQAAKSSGLLTAITENLTYSKPCMPLMTAIVTSLIAALLAGVTTNVATASVMLPVLAASTVAIGCDPRWTLVPATVMITCSFFLPTSSHATALAMERTTLRYKEAVFCGIGVTLICFVIQSVCIGTLGAAIFNFDEMPEWAKITERGN